MSKWCTSNLFTLPKDGRDFFNLMSKFISKDKLYNEIDDLVWVL